MGYGILDDIKELVESRLSAKQLEKYNSHRGYFGTALRKVCKASWVEGAIAEVEAREEARLDARFEQQAVERHNALVPDGFQADETSVYRKVNSLSGAICYVGEITSASVRLRDMDPSRIGPNDYLMIEFTDGWDIRVKGVQRKDLETTIDYYLNKNLTEV